MPFALPALAQAGGSGALSWIQGWESAPRELGVPAVAFFYVTNLGLPFVLASIAVVAAPFTRRTPHVAFLAAWLIALFAVPNLVQASVIAFDMNKLFQAMWPAAAILAAWLMRRWPWPAIAAVLIVSVPSPLLVGAWTAAGNLQMLSTDQLAAADWAATTPERSVFVTDGWLHSFTDPAGRLRVSTFGPYVANLGYDPDARGQQVNEIYCGGDATRAAEAMRALRATYVVDAGRPIPCATPTDFATSPGFRLAYANPALRVWELVPPPP